MTATAGRKPVSTLRLWVRRLVVTVCAAALFLVVVVGLLLAVLLLPVRSDPSRYVQNATANWLNDASKSRPEWVRDVCERWARESPTKETGYIVRRALRTLRKG